MRLKHLGLVTLAVAIGLTPQRPQRASAQAGNASAEFDDDFGTDSFDEQPAALEAAPAAPVASDDRDSEEPPALVHNSLLGTTGGVHVVEAGSGKPGSLRLGIAFDYFRKDGFLVPGERNRHGGTRLSLSVTPIKHLELSAQLTAMGNENTGYRPAVIQVMGDASLIAKGYHSPIPGLTVGGDFELSLLNAVGGLGYQTSATSVGLRGNVSYDLRRLERPKPLIVRANMRYFFDNSAKLIRNVERSRYNTLDDAAAPSLEYRHMVNNVERFAYRINRVDSFSLGFGFEMPFAPKPQLLIHPLLEWNVSLPVNRQDFDCLVTRSATDRDGCLAGEGFAARASILTMGVRVQPKLEGLGLLLAIDIATSGSATYVRELAPIAPYNLLFAASYSYELHKKPPVAAAPVIERVEVPVEKVRGHIIGQVMDKHGLVPVPRAVVHFEGSTLSDMATDEQGKFVSYPFEPGPHTMMVSAEGFEPAACTATLPEDFTDVQARCDIVSRPKQGGINGRVLDAAGKPVHRAKVQLSGPSTLTLESDDDGTFKVGELSAGEYEARVEADGYLMQVVSLPVRERSESAPIFTLLPKPATSLVALTPKKIVIKQQVQFVAGSAEIAAASHGLLSELSDLLLRNPQITRVEVQGHTDNSGQEPSNRELSEQRAQAVRAWLVKAGVDDARLSAAGYGSSRPLAPNITASNRALNRRVELVILDQGQ